ncbi:MAG: Crp/Fnr family transcriptional regulator [Saprospiraceae bacterium]
MLNALQNIMNKDAIVTKISSTLLELPPDCQRELADQAQILSFPKKTCIVKEGQYADRVYFIISGSARAYYLKDGQDITDWFAFENEFITSIQSFFSEIPSPHYVETIEAAQILTIDRATVHYLSDKYRAFERLHKLVITQTMLQLQQRIVSMQFETAQQKYINLLNVMPDIELRVPLIHIASYLGMTIETLSRIRRKNLI